MKPRRSDLFKVGVFVIVAGLILVGSLAWIAGSRLFRPVDIYAIRFEDSVSGLNAGATVEYQGVAIGRVRALRLTQDVPPQVDVAIDVEPGTPIREDTVAYLAGSLVTGIKFVQLQGGTERSPLLEEGGTIRGDVASLEQFRDRATLIASRALDVIRRLDEEVFTTENAGKIGRFLSDLSEVAGTLASAMEKFRTEETGEELARLVKEASEVGRRLNDLLEEFSGQRDDVFREIVDTLQNIRETVEDVGKLVRGVTSEVEGTGPPLGDLLRELTAATRELQETLEVIQSDPSMLLRGRSVPEREFDR